MGYSELIRVPFSPNSSSFPDWLYADRLHTIDRLRTVPVDLFSSVSCVKLYAQQNFTSCFIVYFSLTPVLVIMESISASIFCSLPSSPESRIHHNFSRQISDDDI
ncbi:hypothetical protein T01_7581 [Trichinella spiralis]|uniref:Uncharacterized protein n=1 Tax=Trichinella spiralis TaxID=6334 RepID=A0A0V1BM16_TRISP|nr:hypothetical protein T01_7581 [Trichinella spiralis]